MTIRYGESISKWEESVSASAEDPTLGQRLAASPARAGSAERRILDHIAARPGEVLFASASEIGHATGTSDASVIRTVQRLGYPGLKDFKSALRASLDQGTISAAMRENDGAAGRTSEPRRRVATPDVYAELRELILTGGISTDRYVTEVELAARFGVSRTPVREALRILEQKGLIVRDHRGVRAPVQTRAEMNELYDAHILLNSALVRRACERRTTADIETMRTLNRVMRELPLERAGSQEAAAANRRFHEASWDAARDRTLGVLVRQLNDQLDQWSGTTLDEPGRWPQSLDEHDAIIDAIEQRDAERAEAIVTAHLEAARRIRQARYPA
ncbi:FCD domain-containing protein [Agromyces sp. NPDC060279]|uniref:FCD domain-containing protein n=1 Tax=Agromyces sp. NPDC060279 TaxID=3347092 RepID=UPI0036545464